MGKNIIFIIVINLLIGCSKNVMNIDKMNVSIKSDRITLYSEPNIKAESVTIINPKVENIYKVGDELSSSEKKLFWMKIENLNNDYNWILGEIRDEEIIIDNWNYEILNKNSAWTLILSNKSYNELELEYKLPIIYIDEFLNEITPQDNIKNLEKELLSKRILLKNKILVLNNENPTNYIFKESDKDYYYSLEGYTNNDYAVFYVDKSLIRSKENIVIKECVDSFIFPHNDKNFFFLVDDNYIDDNEKKITMKIDLYIGNEENKKNMIPEKSLFFNIKSGLIIIE